MCQVALGEAVKIVFNGPSSRSTCSTPTALVTALFGLTPAEARVFEQIVAGRTVAEASDALNVEHSTVRTHLLRLFEKTGVRRQTELVRLAGHTTSIEYDAELSTTSGLILLYGSAPRPVLDQARDRALHATALSPNEACCHRILALILMYRDRGDYDAAAQHFARALDLNPYDADTLAQTGFFQAIRGNGDAGLALLDQAFYLNPMHPAWYYFDRGEALLVVGRYQEAAAAFSCLPRKDAWHWARLAACYALAGDDDRARACAREGRQLEPDLTVQAISADLRLKVLMTRNGFDPVENVPAETKRRQLSRVIYIKRPNHR
ncbi:LuxR C-terminal-related transcriptional regulator [Mesorhizobium sp. 43Arga]